MSRIGRGRVDEEYSWQWGKLQAESSRTDIQCLSFEPTNKITVQYLPMWRLWISSFQLNQTSNYIVLRMKVLMKIKNEWALMHGCHPILWCYNWWVLVTCACTLGLFWIWGSRKRWFVDSNETWHSVRDFVGFEFEVAPSFLCGIQ